MLNTVVAYTDGSARPNPGIGGYGVVLIDREFRKELSGGFQRTNSSRMELMAVVKALEFLRQPASITIYCDCSYIVDSVQAGWLLGWVKRGWLLKSGKPVKHSDLWKRYLRAASKHKVVLKQVQGHSGIPENERCDVLAGNATRLKNLPLDSGYKGNFSPCLGEGCSVESTSRGVCKPLASRPPVGRVELHGLVGTPKQIDWAVSIRQQTCFQFCKQAGSREAEASSSIFGLEKDASWWIAKRFDSANSKLTTVFTNYPNEVRGIMALYGIKELGLLKL